MKRSEWDHWVDDLSNITFQTLIDRYSLPASDLSLREYIKQTACGLRSDELKKRGVVSTPEPYADSATGVRIYPDDWVALDDGCHSRTVARRRKKHGITTKGLSAEQLEEFRQTRKLKQQRKRLREDARKLGMSEDSIKQMLKPKRRKNKSQAALTAIIERNAARQLRRRAGTTIASESNISTEDKIAAYEAYFSDPKADRQSEDWAKAKDEYNRLLRHQRGMN